MLFYYSYDITGERVLLPLNMEFEFIMTYMLNDALISLKVTTAVIFSACNYLKL